MKKVHWAGGISLPGVEIGKGYPCCCSGGLAYRIKFHGKMERKAPFLVTCVRCQMMLRKAGLLEENS